MGREIALTGVAVAAAMALAGCGVQVHNETAARFQANPNVGMYPIKVKVTPGALVSQQMSVFAISGDQRVPLSPDANGTWQTMYPVSCTHEFPLQFRVVWRTQGLSTHEGLFPQQPLKIELTPPPLTSAVRIDTSGQPDRKTHRWQGSVPYTIVTAAEAHITGAHIEPTSQDKAGLAAAKAIRIVSAFPVDVSCGEPASVHLASKVKRAQANLVIDTDLPGVPQWTTRVDFVPQQ